MKEEKKKKDDDVIYDLEKELDATKEFREEQKEKPDENPETDPEEKTETEEPATDDAGDDKAKEENRDPAETEVGDEKEGPAEKVENKEVEPQKGDAALESIREMVTNLGAERVLQLIRDNRNAAIEQIIAELKANEDNEILHSGLSVEPKCSSIFDLASFA